MTERARRRSEEPEPEDRELIRRSRLGDRAAFGLLIRRHQRSIHGLGLRLLRNADDADDLVQETFLRAWRGLDRFDVDRPLRPWLLRIATNRALTVLEAAKRRPAEALDDSFPSGGPSPEENLDRTRLHERIRRAVGELPEEQRAVLALRVSQGLSYREIADVLDVPAGTVMSRLARARETLRRRVRR